MISHRPESDPSRYELVRMLGEGGSGGPLRTENPLQCQPPLTLALCDGESNRLPSPIGVGCARSM